MLMGFATSLKLPNKLIKNTAIAFYEIPTEPFVTLLCKKKLCVASSMVFSLPSQQCISGLKKFSQVIYSESSVILVVTDYNNIK